MSFLIRMASLVAALALAGAAQAEGFQTLVKSLYAEDWQAHPVTATELGLHDGDGKLDDVSAAAVAGEAKRLHAALDRLHAIDAATLSPMDRDDRDVLAASLQGRLAEDETIQQWRRNPDVYVSFAGSAVYTLIERDFAPLESRLRSVIAREAAIPAMLAAGRQNLSDVAPIFLEIARENLAGTEDLIGKDVPTAFAGVTDPALKAKLAETTKIALAALKEFGAAMTALKPAAPDSFALGPARFKLLLAEDLIDVPADTILAAGKAQLARDQAAFHQTGLAIDPQHPDDAHLVMEKDHPDGPHLIPTARDLLVSLQGFVRAHDLLTLPSDALPVVAETPVFQRATVSGQLDWPGPFETHATTAYYDVTPPDPGLSAAETEKYLAYYNVADLQNLSVHEAMPGHFVQFLTNRAHPAWSLIRRNAQSYTATEGWAHYAEQMMLDQGLGGGDPKWRLAQLQDALLRDCRLIASISMHTQGMSLADATKLMVSDCEQPEFMAYKEARRGTEDPGYFSYALGKLEILKLRADVQAREGKDFSLGRFHDRFLAAGLVPIAIIRREILGADGPML